MTTTGVAMPLARSSFLVVRRVIRGLLLVGVGYLLVTGVQVWMVSRHTDAHPAQAIVVMGAAQYNGVPSPDLEARLHTALGLWDRGLASQVVVTGAKEPGDQFTEAESGAAYLEAHGVPTADIVEIGGDDTWQSLSGAASVLRAEQRPEVLVVSDGFHEDRSCAIATDAGLQPSPVPAVGSPITAWGSIPYFAKETLAVAVGRITGYSPFPIWHFHGAG